MPVDEEYALRRHRRALPLACGLLALTACEGKPDPKTGWWRWRCADSHQEYRTSLVPSAIAPGGISAGGGFTYQGKFVEVCDRYAPYCPKGRQCDPDQRPGESSAPAGGVDAP